MKELNNNEQTILKGIDKFVFSKLNDDKTGHDYAHIQRVVKMAQRLASDSDQGQLFVVLASAELHDVIDEKIVSDQTKAENEVRAFLKDQDVAQTDIEAIFAIITHMSFSKNLEHHYQLSVEGQIVQDADRLDAIGAIGIGRVFYYGGAHGHTMYDPQIAPRTEMTHAQYRQNETVINHFYEKLLKLVDLMNTKAAKQIAEQRTKVLTDFLDEFKAEWNQTK
ncbi:HD domain-containing protein [Pediococcus inopinatus]|uniref:HD domain-containing protein n=1 Tax=Pediococcus inopinatus TaxID=114090 RepID=A0ABZ0Q830_9LACO|nr:HD domain-containing protein [Pediococcus inopinatus]AVK99586.1 phosphohydrolase [Pediococcus inopinatus]KRN63796.1 HD superfamily hydrolase [Pediococcus inopinatus]WPC18674.1 HD domain-containing protein [Pediococcus inopinatus]WPC22288.1 HD domain-containing protein [Pediococcus inopinatus]WPP08777.1 HD domain-containing protein [Pediococcus inopinatus]